MKYLKTYESFRFLEESFENNFPKSVKIYTSNGTYELVKADFTREIDIIRCSYWHNTAADGNVSRDGEPDLLMFDIHFINNDKGLKTIIHVTYGDNMVSDFSIEAPNKIKVNLYNGFKSKLDSDTQFGFEDDTLDDLCKLFNKFNESYRITKQDLTFIDKYPDSYKEPKQTVPDSSKEYYEIEKNFKYPISSQKQSEYSLSQGKKVLVINNSLPPENRYLINILKYLQIKGINNIVASTTEELESILKSNKISAIISSGSDKRVSDEDSNQMNLKVIGLQDIPFLGICFGFQSLCKLLGSKIETGDFNHNNIIVNDVKPHFLFKGVDLNKQQFSVSFRDYPVNCPDGYKVICKIGDKIAGVANDYHKNWGLLFHPEDIEATWKILDNFIGLIDQNSKEQDAIKRGKFNSLK